MRDRSNRDRSRSQPVFEIVMLLPGGAVAEGSKEPDRFRCSSETRSAKLHGKHRDMIMALYRRGRFDVLRARLAGLFTTTQLYVAFYKGKQALNELMAQAVPQAAPVEETRESLRDAIEEYLAFNTGRDDAEKPRERRLMLRYAEWVEVQARSHGQLAYMATADDLTPEQVSRYLNGLTSARHGRGRPCTAATKNRNRASLGGLATRLVQRVNGGPGAMRSKCRCCAGQRRVARFADGPLSGRACERRSLRSPEAEGLRPSQRSSAA